MQWLRILAFPISLMYALVVHLRNYLYDIGIFGSKEFTTPIICIGNLSTGGTGKTPMVSFLVDVLGKDVKVAMLSRGYRRKSKGFLLADQGVTARTIGDEPFQLFKKHTNLMVAVDANRGRGISKLEKEVHPDIVLLDDAFQHRKVKPQHSFLLTAYDNLYVDDWYLPTGDLRDAKNQAKRADIIVVTKCPELPSKAEREAILKKLKPALHQRVVFGTLVYGMQVIGIKKNLDLHTLKDSNIALVTGIAKPQPLVSFLEEQNLNFKHFDYADHHYFSETEFESFRKFDVVLTTEKDFVRMDGRLKNAFYVEMAHHFNSDDLQTIKSVLNTTITPRS